MAETATTFEDILTTKILEALNDYTIGHPTMVCNIIRKEMEKYNVKMIKPIDEEKLNRLAINDLFPEDFLHAGIMSSQAKLELSLWKRGYRKANEE